MPTRADMDPAEIPALLPHLMMIETAERLEDFRYRLCGTEVCRGFAADHTGWRFSALRSVANFDAIFAGYWKTYAEKQPQFYRGRIFAATQKHVHYSRLTLPLSDDGEHVNMVLGGVVFFSACAPAPV